VTEQIRMFQGFEIQAEYLDVPGVSSKLALRKFIPDDVDQPEAGDVMELTIKFKIGVKNKIDFNNDGNRKGEVADNWFAVPIVDEIHLSAYMSRDEWQRIWEEKHGAVGE
jgi:hypothetical protein